MSNTKYSSAMPLYTDQALYMHDHKVKKKTKYIGVKKHLGKNHNKKEIRVLEDGVYRSIPID